MTAAPALLALEDGRVFRGTSFGAEGESLGEAVFNTGMTGYQETLTDPSYHRQVVVMTAPHVGNTGVNDLDAESARVWVAGFVVRDPSPVASSWRAQRSLDAELRRWGVVGVAGLDTRAMTRHLRERGALRCGVSSITTDPQELLERVRRSPSMQGADLAGEVSTATPYVVPATTRRRFRVTAIDLGVKRSALAHLAGLGCDVTVLPASATAADVLATEPHGVFLSNGPGDPAATGHTVDTVRGILGRRPVLGICLGHQLLGRALGLETYKLRFGHRGVNQPVQDLRTGRVAITSHNHGFAVRTPATSSDGTFDTDYGRAAVSHVDLNDGVVEGLRCLDVPAWSVQYHPEAAPGPHDAAGLFTGFIELMSTAGGWRVSDRTEVAADLARAAGKNIGAGARELGEVPVRGEPPRRSPAEEQLAARALEVLREEVARVVRMREQYDTERAAGAPGRENPRLHAMAANLEGASRFALRMGLITPGEAREVWHEAALSGVHTRPALGREDHPRPEAAGGEGGAP